MGKYQEYADRLVEMRRRLEVISEEMSRAITIEFNLAARIDKAADDLRAAKKKVEEL